MKKAVFLDRDGTLIKDRGYLKHIHQVEFYSYTFTSLKIIQKEYLLFIITNQSGIAKGLTTHTEVEKINRFIANKLRQAGIRIHGIFYCPHDKEDRCRCRKPNTKFIEDISRKYPIDLNRSFVIGDHVSDVEMALRVGAKGIYVLTGHGKKHLDEVKKISHPDILICKNLAYATQRLFGKTAL